MTDRRTSRGSSASQSPSLHLLRLPLASHLILKALVFGDATAVELKTFLKCLSHAPMEVRTHVTSADAYHAEANRTRAPAVSINGHFVSGPERLRTRHHQ